MLNMVDNVWITYFFENRQVYLIQQEHIVEIVEDLVEQFERNVGAYQRQVDT
jgi:hypothetical protein